MTDLHYCREGPLMVDLHVFTLNEATHHKVRVIEKRQISLSSDGNVNYLSRTVKEGPLPLTINKINVIAMVLIHA